MMPIKTSPRRWREREGESNSVAPTISPPLGESKPLDAVEKKLSLALDALLDAIDTTGRRSNER